jgi:hypothetical protein
MLSVPTGYIPFAPGSGESKTGLGKYSVHERAIRITAVNPADKTFWVLAQGRKQPILTSVAVRRSYSFCPVKSFAVLGLGLDIPEGCVSTCGAFNPKQGVKTGENFVWEGCSGTKWRDSATGAFLGLTTETPGCLVEVGEYLNGDKPVRPITDITLSDPLSTAEGLTFGDGDATQGDNSCFYTFVGGVYAKLCR